MELPLPKFLCLKSLLKQQNEGGFADTTIKIKMEFAQNKSGQLYERKLVGYIYFCTTVMDYWGIKFLRDPETWEAGINMRLAIEIFIMMYGFEVSENRERTKLFQLIFGEDKSAYQLDNVGTKLTSTDVSESVFHGTEQTEITIRHGNNAVDSDAQIRINIFHSSGAEFPFLISLQKGVIAIHDPNWPDFYETILRDLTEYWKQSA